MKVTLFMAIAWSLAFLICTLMAQMLYSVYWKPRVLERFLKQQGIRGTSYKPIYGDKKVMQDMNTQAWSVPMSSLNHKIVPRVSPFVDLMVHNYGNVCLSWFGTMPRLIVAKAELMKMILNDKSGQFKRPPISPLVDLLTMGLSTLEAEKWATRRRLLTPAFHHEKLQGMVPEFLASCCNLIDRWKSILADSSDGWSEIDVSPELKTLSADVISRTAFGSSYEEGKKIFDLQEEQTVLALEAFQGLYFPGLKYIPTKKNRRRYKVDNEIKGILREIIHKKQKAIQNGESSSDDDLLGLLLQCKEQNGSDMTIEDIIEECKLFYFAGQETTAQWLTWALIILAMHPEWQEKARQEVLQICGDKTPNADILNQLKIVSHFGTKKFNLNFYT
ncbi:OLC1v1031963C1 [Oldenlandia corymbosa var. corymbosa]|uniref:OLC1v1031963C1 n=1 Tax=Oldenlandia corymbosa var. corymbosa TaxID=529605 RepID=A0AAV1CLS4_OLDCO|nr:OLC1v1031963C1 [Oldenlandia corymbosa var. corymbosa]